MSDEVMTVPQAAERLQVKPETVRRMLRRGDLAGWLIGGRAGYRIFRSEIERVLSGGRPSSQRSPGSQEGE